MNLTPEQQELGRRSFLKAVAGVPAIVGLGAAAALRGPVSGGPVRVGFVGLGGQGRVLLEQADPGFVEVRALCDINPTQLARASEVLTKTNRPTAKHYADWQAMLHEEDLEAVVLAPPLWQHAEITVGCLEAGKHVFCEKMMAWDVPGCERMLSTAQRTGRVLEIGYQRFYNSIYQAAHEGIIKTGTLGDVYLSRLVWHRNGTWRRTATPPSPDYSPAKWGYPTFDHLVNWRLYEKYSRGLLAELGSHQISIVNWFFNATPEAVLGTGGVYRFNDGGREVDDHVFATFEYPGGRTATFSTIESNAFENYYEAFFGTKGTLILEGEAEAYLFSEGDAAASAIEVTAKSGPALEASESRAADAAGQARSGAAAGRNVDRLSAYRNEISAFCAAIRTGRPLACGPERAIHSARACLRAYAAVDQKTRLKV